MTKIGDHIRCPKCGRESRVVWISQDGKLAGLKCTGYHSQISPPPTRFSKNIQTKTKKGMVFLVEIGTK